MLLLNTLWLKTSRAFQLASEFSAKVCSPLYSQLDPKQIGLCARALDLGEKYGKIILTRYMKWDEAKAHKTVQRLVWDYPNHDFVIDMDELKELYLPAAKINGQLIEKLDDLRGHLIDAYLDDISMIELIEPDSTSGGRKDGKQKGTTKKNK